MSIEKLGQKILGNSEKIKIIKAKPEHAQEVRKIEHLVWGEEVTNQYDGPIFVRFGYVFIAQIGTQIIGAIVALKTNNNEVFVSDIVVHPSHQGKGIGEKLYKKLLQNVKGSNVISFLNPDITSTINLHKKLGGKIIKKVNNPYNLKKGLETGVRLLVRIKN